MSAERTILDLVDKLLSEQFSGESWAAWRALLKAMFGLPMSDADLDTFRELTARESAPEARAREVWAICGRRAGKSVASALVAVYLTTCKRYELSPGERGVFMVIAADRRQARVVRRYISGLLHSHPALESLIAKETKTEIQLTNGLSIEIHTASFRTVRGYTVVGAVCDEIAFWPTDDAAEPDREILAALRPAMATIPDAMLLCLSSPYARKGALYEAHKKHYGEGGDVLVIQAETRALNPTVPQEVIDRAYKEDPEAARAEYGAEFRKDVEGFVSLDVIQRATEPEVAERPPVAGVRYVGFLDFAGGSGRDSATLAIAHEERRCRACAADARTVRGPCCAEQDLQPIAVLDAVREVRPPFSPQSVCKDFAETLKRYRVGNASADRWAGDFPKDEMQKHGIRISPAAKPKSDIYKELLPMLNSGTVELLDMPRLSTQLAGLERRTARGGRDSIDHAPGDHDDLANAAAGALTVASLGTKPLRRRRLAWG